MRIQTLNGGGISQKPDRVWVTVVSAETTNNIGQGEPCAFNALDGMSVVKLATAGAALADVGIAGISDGIIKPGQVGVVQVYGITALSIPVAQRTKASTDSSFASASVPAGAVLKPDTVNNAMSTGATVAASANLPLGFLPVSTNWASSTLASGSNTPYSTQQPLSIAVFLRIL